MRGSCGHGCLVLGSVWLGWVVAGRYEQWLGVVCSCGEVMRPTGAEKISSKNIINDRLTQKKPDWIWGNMWIFFSFS